MKMKRKFYDALMTIGDECKNHDGWCYNCNLKCLTADGSLKGCILEHPSLIDLSNFEIVENNDIEVGEKKMSKNLIYEVCQLLNVEINEEFKLDNSTVIYKFDNEGLKFYNNDSNKWCYTSNAFFELMAGKLEIIKLPWKPKYGEGYYTFYIYTFSEATKWKVTHNFWRNDPYDIALFDKGWVYRTCEEAKSALPKVAEEMGIKYSLEDENMTKNVISEAVNLLGLKIGEKFQLRHYASSTIMKYKYAINGVGNLEYFDDKGWEGYAIISLQELLGGAYEIIKLSYRPKKGKAYFYPIASDVAKELLISCKTWKDTPSDFAMLKLGWVYRTREEAEAALPKIKEEMKVFIEGC